MSRITKPQIDKLAEVMGRTNARHPMTMRALSGRLQCSFQAAERRFKAWMDRDMPRLESVEIREGEKGPLSVAYFVV